MTPLERWQTGLIPRLPESRAALDLLLMPVARGRKIRRNGIHFKTHRYWCDGLLLYIGEIATLRYDPSRLEQIVVYAAGRRIGTAARVADERISYGRYRKRRTGQIRMIKSFADSGESVHPSARNREDSHSENTREIEGMIARYQDRMEKTPQEEPNGQIKPFAEPEQGEDWW
jgi:hypothetical protein